MGAEKKTAGGRASEKKENLPGKNNVIHWRGISDGFVKLLRIDFLA